MSDADWVIWWCCTWRDMHPAWQVRVGDDLAQRAAVTRSQHGELLACLGITPSPPPPPIADALLWLSLSIECRDQALALVQAICFAAHADRRSLTDEQWAWCRSLAKALRPGLWLLADKVDPRAMLGGWLGDNCWLRLRLAWAPDDSLRPTQGLPTNKLDSLWRAVLWKVNAAC